MSMTRTPDPENPSSTQWLGIREFSERFGISERTCRRMIADSVLPAYRVGPRIIRIRLEDAQALLKPVIAEANR